mmetsp:Transcript_25031/g.35285  ORF Transcript_25031/g.35285 Transcript_25031/m.35285 type:complete len:396 (-) Transcript_25031:477-1664(-)
MKEEVREHRLETTSLHARKGSAGASIGRTNTSKNDKSSYINALTMSLPVVLVESNATRKRRKKAQSCYRRNWKFILLLLCLLVVFRYMDDTLVEDIAAKKSPAGFHKDYATIDGIADLTSEFVEPWCFYGKKGRCNCKDPMKADSRISKSHWAKAHHLNKEQAKGKGDSVDVLFLGDSIMEGWNGKSYGHSSPRSRDVPAIFKKLFTKDGGGQFEGLALGISGDTSPNLLWRIQNGELPPNLKPSVIWLLIGTNDFGNTWCSAELVVIGILRVVEELRQRLPGCTIVVNGLLPRTFNRKGFVARGRKKGLIRTARPAMPSLWDDIEAVNDELKRYCQNHEKMKYFDTKVFFKDASVDEHHLKIDKKLMSDFLHPTAKGYKRWGNEINTTLRKLIP